MLSGGAAKGSYQVGVLRKWMGEENIDYDLMCGISVGALNIAGIAQTPKGDPRSAIAHVEAFWLNEVSTRSVYKRWFPFGRLHALWHSSVYDSSPLYNLVHDNIDVERVKNNGRAVAVGAICLDTGEYGYGREYDPDFAKWVVASASFPVFFSPIEIGGRMWGDGGIRHVTPMGQAIKMGADEIDIIMCSNMNTVARNARESSAIPDLMIRTFELMSDKIMRADAKMIRLKNELADTNKMFKKVKIRVVMPNDNLIDDSFDFDPDVTRRLIERGYNDASNVVEWGGICP